MPAYKSSAETLWFIGDFVHCCGWVVAAAFIIAMIFSAHQGVTGSGDVIIILLLFPVFIYGIGWAFRHFARKIALRICSRAATSGDGSAQNWLGHTYANGWGVPKNLTEAVVWWRKAADQESADAQFELARIYEAGLGVEQDFTSATTLYAKAAEQGHRHARNGLARLYAQGRCEPSDNSTAAYWYERFSKRKEITRVVLERMFFLVLVPLAYSVFSLFAFNIGYVSGGTVPINFYIWIFLLMIGLTCYFILFRFSQIFEKKYINYARLVLVMGLFILSYFFAAPIRPGGWFVG